MHHDANEAIHNEDDEYICQQTSAGVADDDSDNGWDCHTCIAGTRCSCDDHGGGYSHYHCTVCDRGMNMPNPDCSASGQHTTDYSLTTEWN